MNVFGIQCQFDSADAERYNRELKPTAVMVINVVKREFLERLKADNPGVKLIYRHHPNYEWRSPAPEEAAREAVRKLRAEVGHLLATDDRPGLLDYVTDNNEYILSRDHMAAELIAEGDRYMAAFIVEARRELGLGTCWGNFNTGHWGEETVAYFPMALAAAEMDGDSPICFHEYNWPEIPDAGHWTCGKVLRAMPPIRERYDVRAMVTEFGVDDGGDPHKGWRLAHDDFGTAAAMFCQGVRWYSDDVAAQSPWLEAVLFFGCGMVAPWGSFDIAPIIGQIKAALAAPSPEQPPPEEPPGEEEEPSMDDEIKVYDLDDVERDFAWAVERYGVAYRRAEVASGQKVYRLVELRQKVGPASLVTKVVDVDGKPVANMDVAFYWPGAPDPPDPPTEVLPHDWRHDGQEWHADGGPGTRFVHGKTNANGDVGPGMGTGAYHGIGEGGPHAVWVRDPNIPSDICEKLGMLAGTPHDHLDQVFRLATAGEGPQEPEEPTGELVKVARLEETDQDAATLCIAYPKAIAYDTDVAAGITGSDLDLDTAPLEAFSHEGKDYALGCVCCDFEGGGPREYWIEGYDLNTGVSVTPMVKETFSPKPDLRKVTVVYDFGEPEPPPVEPPGDVAAVYDMMAAAHTAIMYHHQAIVSHHEVLADCCEKLAELAEGG